MNENDVFHISLDDYIKITDEEIIKNLNDIQKKFYEEANEVYKNMLIETIKEGLNKNNQNETKDYTINELKVLDKNKLIDKLKEILPSQYHVVFNSN